jgi:hypothetical protein
MIMAIETGQTNTRPFWAILTLVLLILLLVVVRMVDWDAGSGLGTVPVTVTVLKEGTPIPNVSITLLPMHHHDASLRPAAGTTDSDGRCQVTTLRFDDGAIPGPYSVGLEKIPEWTLKFNDPSLLNVDPGAPPSGSDLREPDPTRMYSMARREEAKPQPEALPAKLVDPSKSGLTVQVEVDSPNNFTFDVR